MWTLLAIAVWSFFLSEPFGYLFTIHISAKAQERENEVLGSLFQEFAFLGGKVKISWGGNTPPFIRGPVEFGV